MRIMGLDLGEKYIGVAVSDQLGWTAQGVTTIKREGEIERDLDKIQAITKQYGVEKIIVGLPRNMDGSAGIQAQKAVDFAACAARRLKISVETWDERLSTAAAERLLINADMRRAKRRRVIDKMAASIILQNYLDAMQKRR